MKKTEYVTIGSERFELCGETNTRGSARYGANSREIFDVYSKPSSAKVSIWHDWCKWADEVNANLDIASHTAHFFTINGNVEVNGEVYQLYITAMHNRAFKVVE